MFRNTKLEPRDAHKLVIMHKAVYLSTQRYGASSENVYRGKLVAGQNCYTSVNPTKPFVVGQVFIQTKNGQLNGTHF